MKKGDPILIIEAMKMEHVIRAPTAGTVGSIACKAGDLVDEKLVLATVLTDEELKEAKQ